MFATLRQLQKLIAIAATRTTKTNLEEFYVAVTTVEILRLIFKQNLEEISVLRYFTPSNLSLIFFFLFCGDKM